MSNENEPNVEGQSEIDSLKERANIMGIKYHPNIGLDKLKAKVAAGQKSEPNPTASEEQDTIQDAQEAAVADTFTPGKHKTAAQFKTKRKQDALRLVRIRVSNMNPVKNAMVGEIIQVGNAELGVIKKYVPFNAEHGWHVPAVILQELRAKRYTSHFKVKINGKDQNRHRLVPEYSIEVMDPLSGKELEELKQRQIMAGTGQ